MYWLWLSADLSTRIYLPCLPGVPASPLSQCLCIQLQVVADKAVEHAHSHNRRTLDVLAARAAFYLSLSNERLGTLASLRPRLLSLHATAVLNHDDIGQEVLLNLLLRNYLHYSLYDQAEKLRAQAQRPEAPRSNQQYCRYLYFLGRIRAVQLEYSEAKECLQQAARKVWDTCTHLSTLFLSTDAFLKGMLHHMQSSDRFLHATKKS